MGILKAIGRRGAAGLAAILLFWFPAPGNTEKSSGEYALTAAFIYNFAKYVEWPDSAFKKNKEFSIASLGRSPLDRQLAALNGKSVQGRNIVFQQFNSPEEAAQCHILFISRSEHSRLGSILDFLRDLPVLTISDSDDFCRKGGMLLLVNENGKIVFDLNIRETHNAKLKPNPQLLKLTRKIYGKP